jgi:HAD superfamily hydrolase (TIGR01509 family)
MIKNILFDLDGVLFDGCDFHAEMFLKAVSMVLPEQQITRKYHDAHLNALPTRDKLKKLQIDPVMAQKIYTVKQELTAKNIGEFIRPDKKVEDICVHLRSLGYELFCVSNSIRSTIETCLSGMGVRKYFTGVISNEDVSAPKPSPEPYLTLYRLYGLEPTECLILEDSEYGIASAKASGGHVLPVRDCDEVRLKLILNRLESQ